MEVLQKFSVEERHAAHERVKALRSYCREIWEENLRQNCKVPELRQIAKVYGVTGCWEMRKDDLIKTIVTLEIASEEEEDKMEIQKRTTEDYGKNVEVGTIIAFKHENKVISGKIVSKRETCFQVQTIRGTILVVNKSDVQWYKTGRRWPKHIFEQLRGINSGQEEK